MGLSDKIWWTRKARISASARLLSNDFHAQLLVTWYSSATVCISIYYLKWPQPDVSAVIMAAFSIITLCASIFVGGRNFKERSILLKECYEQLDQLYSKAKYAEDNSISVNEIQQQYLDILHTCENHTNSDYKDSLVRLYFSSEKITKKPSYFDLSEYFMRLVFKYLLATLFYALPLIIFTIIKKP